MNGIARRCTPIENGQCGHGLRACLTLTVRVAGRHRLLRIPVDPRKGSCDLMTSVGHELQHANEALSDSAITTNRAVFLFHEHVEDKEVVSLECRSTAVRQHLSSAGEK
jgi:hypothetical protein